MRRPGFTIIELLVALSIIGLLIATASVGISNTRRTARDSQRLADVFGISNAFELAASLNRRQYPDNAYSSSRNHLMCANEAYRSGDTNNIDISVFKVDPATGQGTIPVDPKPITRLTNDRGCTSYQNGYTYHTNYNDNNASLAYFHNGTSTEGYSFVLEFGLENERPTDQSVLVDRSFFDLPAVTDRNVYYILGRYCGAKCY